MFFNVYRESNDNDHITTILTYQIQNPVFLKNVTFRNSKNFLYNPKLSRISSEISYKSK